jgi:nucleotide-binding universal stress UspA family protein
MKILLAVDGSVYSDAAVEAVAQRPWPPESEIKVITAAEMPVPVGMEPWAVSANYFDELDTFVRKAAQTVIDGTVAKLETVKDKTLKITGEIIQGPPRQVIVDEAEEWGADLIVMGSRGLGAWSRMFLGSVSSAVVHHAKCSVEIVRDRDFSEKKIGS